MFILHVVIYDKDNVIIGEVINPFDEVHPNDFAYNLLLVLGVITKITETLSTDPLIEKRIQLKSAQFIEIENTPQKTLMLRIPADHRDFSWG